MTQIIDLPPTDSLHVDDEGMIRQGSSDYRIRLQLAATLSWGARNGYSRIAEYVIGLSYQNTETYSTFNEKVYFVKYGVPLPYKTTLTNPDTDINLTTRPYQQYKDAIDDAHKIGDVKLKFDASSPNEEYPWQVWELMTGDASIRLGDGTLQTDIPEGENAPSVPVTVHKHRAYSYSTFYGSPLPEHKHVEGGPAFTPLPFGSVTIETARLASDDKQNISSHPYTSSVSAGTPSGAVDTVTDIEWEGEINPTLNVRGSHIKLNVWRRVS